MAYHIVVTKSARDIVNAEVRRRNRNSPVKYRQESVATEIIEQWEEKRKSQ